MANKKIDLGKLASDATSDRIADQLEGASDGPPAALWGEEFAASGTPKTPTPAPPPTPMPAK